MEKKYLLDEIKKLKDSIEWYRRTYETRSLLGIVKDKILKEGLSSLTTKEWNSVDHGVVNFVPKEELQRNIELNFDNTAETTQKLYDLYTDKENEHYQRCRDIEKTFTYTPLISIITPVYNTPLDVLIEMILSVRNQIYYNWELCIVNASPDNASINACLKFFQEFESRIKVINIESNLGISGNSNEGLKMAQGEFVALLDHDDLITPNALFEVVNTLQEDKLKYDFYYTDKDMLSEKTEQRLNSLFKPKWSPDIMYSANYLTHFCTIRKSLAEKINGFSPETDGSQDWDIFLRIVENTNKIHHIPHICYHWRILQTSVASGIGAKPYALDAQLKAIGNHFKRTGEKANVRFYNKELSVIKIDWDIPKESKISVIVYNHSNDETLNNCLKSIESNSPNLKKEIIVISENKITSKLNPKVILSKTQGYWDAFNLGAKNATGDVFVFLDSETSIVSNETIEDLVGWARKKDIGIVGSKIMKENNEINNIGIVLNGKNIVGAFNGAQNPYYGVLGYTDWYRNFSAFSEVCFSVEKSKFNAVKRFNEEYKEFSQIEFGLKLIAQGYRNTYTPYAVVKNNSDLIEKLNTNNKEYKKLATTYSLPDIDPYWNPNISPLNSIPESKVKPKVQNIPKGEFQIQQVGLWDRYGYDAKILVEWFDFSLENLKPPVKSNSKINTDVIKSVSWFLPAFDYAFYAGVYTILRYANYLTTHKNIINHFIIVGDVDVDVIKKEILRAFPKLERSLVFSISQEKDLTSLPPVEISICTLWTTAYFLLKFKNTMNKFYFIQDYEPLFYPAGSTYAQAEATYSFGFYGITNTIGLKNMYEKSYGGKAEALIPCIDTNVFHSNLNPPNKKNKKFKVFFYGRPGHPRNGFELGAQALKVLKKKLGDKVEIVTAGADWQPEEYGLKGIVNNLGRLKYEETGELYRSCDAGLVMMFTKHPSYLPFELMACGCAVVSNFNESTTWLLKDKDNCILSQTSATAIAENIENLLLNTDLRKKITTNAHKEIMNNHVNWEEKLEIVYNFMLKVHNNRI